MSITESFDTATPTGRLLLNIMLTFAQFERELASERVKDKLLERAKKGMWKGGFVPFGYKKENKKLYVDDKESEVVNSIYETYIETSSLFAVYDKLKEDKTVNRKGKIFTKKAIADILRNEIHQE